MQRCLKTDHRLLETTVGVKHTTLFNHAHSRSITCEVASRQILLDFRRRAAGSRCVFDCISRRSSTMAAGMQLHQSRLAQPSRTQSLSLKLPLHISYSCRSSTLSAASALLHSQQAFISSSSSRQAVRLPSLERKDRVVCQAAADAAGEAGVHLLALALHNCCCRRRQLLMTNNAEQSSAGHLHSNNVHSAIIHQVDQYHSFKITASSYRVPTSSNSSRYQSGSAG
jgi:hypothetical protein